jgi:hypothetical protein
MPSRHKKASGIEWAFPQPLTTLNRTIQRGPGRACGARSVQLSGVSHCRPFWSRKQTHRCILCGRERRTHARRTGERGARSETFVVLFDEPVQWDAASNILQSASFDGPATVPTDRSAPGQLAPATPRTPQSSRDCTVSHPAPRRCVRSPAPDTPWTGTGRRRSTPA